jgi:hypothetical protein
MAVKEPEFLDFFKEVPDHRIARRKLYSIEEILLLLGLTQNTVFD